MIKYTEEKTFTQDQVQQLFKSVVFVHYVLVHPEYQGQKIAGNMVEYIRDKYKNYLYIEGMQEDSKNVAFYERHGFHVMEGGTPIQICNFSDKR